MQCGIGRERGGDCVGAGVQGNLDIYITQDGHGVSLRKVLEMEILEHDDFGKCDWEEDQE